MASTSLDKLKRKRRDLDQQIKAAQARRRDIAGGVVLKFLADNPDSDLSRQCWRMLDGAITKPKDRDLMGLAEQTENVTNVPALHQQYEGCS